MGNRTANAIFNGYAPSKGNWLLQADFGGSSLEGSTWLKRFASEVAKDSLRTKAWKRLSDIYGASNLIEVVYLFTSRSTRQCKEKDAIYLLIREIDRLILDYDNLLKRLSALQQRPDLGSYGSIMSGWFFEESQRLQSGRESLKFERKHIASARTPSKTDPRDYYLFWIATSLRRATGSYQFHSIVLIIDAASAAHGERTHQHTSLGLKKRMQRYMKRHWNFGRKAVRHTAGEDVESS